MDNYQKIKKLKHHSLCTNFENPAVSVILSVYNGDKYLGEAIESVLNQTFSDFEFIIINDGSTDKSLDIIKKYEKNDERIVLIDRGNKGLIASLNEGIERAKGKYIARMDADDICYPNRFEQQVSFMEQNKEIIVCGSWVEIFYDNEKNSHIRNLPETDIDLKTQLLFASPFVHPSVIIRKSILEDYNIKYDSRFLDAEDYQLWVKLSKYGRFANLNKALIKYRYLEDSVSRIADGPNKEAERALVLGNIYQEGMQNIDLEFSEKDKQIHFKISNNDRLKRANLTAKELISHIDRILKKVKDSKGINYDLLLSILTKRCVWYFIQKKDFKIVFSKYFFLGSFFMLKENLK